MALAYLAIEVVFHFREIIACANVWIQIPHNERPVKTELEARSESRSGLMLQARQPYTH